MYSAQCLSDTELHVDAIVEVTTQPQAVLPL